MMSATLICAAVGLNVYFASGISSAAAIRFFASDSALARNASATGAPCAARIPGANKTAAESVRCLSFMDEPSDEGENNSVLRIVACLALRHFEEQAF